METHRYYRQSIASTQTPIMFLTVLTLATLALITPASSQGADLAFNIAEEEDVGKFIGSVTENQNLYRNLTSSQRKQLRYGLLDQSSYPASLFRVDASSGGIYVAKRIDRESPECLKRAECQLTFNVALSSGRIPFSNIARVEVGVADTNDNPPYFPQQLSGRVSLDLSEAAVVGTAIKISGAADLDYDNANTVQRYALTAYTSVFSVNATHNLDGSSVLDLTLLRPLDREKIGSYDFVIMAYDGGSPPRSAALAVNIRVTDENDNPPVFHNKTYTVELRDEVVADQVILQVSASDLDSGDYGTVRYQFSSLQRRQLEAKFKVDAVTGEVKAVGSLPAGQHQFIVEALDGGSPPLKSQTVVTVKVVSSRNNPPSLQINTLSNGSNSFVLIPEDASPGAFLAFVTADDPDEGPKGHVTCRLDDSEESGDLGGSGVLSLTTLAGKGYTLTLQGALDREARASYNVTVTCEDRGDPPLSSVRSLVVKVSDVNDNAPVFAWRTFSHTVPEGNYTDRHILQVSAVDPDQGRNAQVTYSLQPSASPPFTIHPDTGIVSARGKLDREKTPFYSFKVFATDRGAEPRTATANVSITLEDVNDQYPTFTQTIFEFRVPENAPARTVLGRLSAQDRDVGVNGQFQFFYAGSLDGADPFVVETNGTVWTSGPLDREHRDSFSFTVMVRDKGMPPKTTYASVVVTVLDVNDNWPKIDFPVAGNHTVHISTPPERDMVLVKVVAYDPDAGENGSLHYVVVSGAEDGSLDIDPSGGQVKVKDVGRLRNRIVYRLLVGVEDYGVPPKRSNTTIWVEVNYDNSSGVMTRDGHGVKRTEDYVMIVAAVAGTTVVLSAIIIVAICFIFRQDRQFRNKHPQGNNQAGINDDGEFFSNVPGAPGNLCDDEKLRPSFEEEGDDDNKHPDCYDDDDFDDENGFKKQLAMETFRSSLRKKEVSFASAAPVAEEGNPAALEATAEVGSPVYRNTGHYGIATGGGGGGHGEKAEFAKHPHVFLNRQLDEVGSDTSGDTGTSDSGRGGSEDDVNIDQILHGERQAAVPHVMPSLENERYTRFPPPRLPASKGGSGDLHPHNSHPHHQKPYHVRFDTRSTTPVSALRESPSQHDTFSSSSRGGGDPNEIYSRDSRDSHHPHHPHLHDTFSSTLPPPAASSASATHRARSATPSSQSAYDPHPHYPHHPGNKRTMVSPGEGAHDSQGGGGAPPTNTPHPQRTVSFSPTVRTSSPGPSIFSPRTSRDGVFSSLSSPSQSPSSSSSGVSTFRDVSFTPVPQHYSPVRTPLSTFSSASPSPASFSTFHKTPSSVRGGGSSVGGVGSVSAASAVGGTSVDDDSASTTTSGSYTVNPEDLRMEGYIGADVIV